jgi:hypothetical protein
MSTLLDRASAADLMQLATGDGRAAGHIGAVLILEAAPGFSLKQAQRLLGERIRAVPRLRLCRGCASGCTPPRPDAGGHTGPTIPHSISATMSGASPARRPEMSGHCSTWPRLR